MNESLHLDHTLCVQLVPLAPCLYPPCPPYLREPQTFLFCWPPLFSVDLGVKICPIL